VLTLKERGSTLWLSACSEMVERQKRKDIEL
jgi:hypothetical protein